jgi:peptide/nickel transport system substrate-binding protein
MIMDILPGVPYAHTKPAIAFKANVRGYVPSPLDNQFFKTVYLEGGGE